MAYYGESGRPFGSIGSPFTARAYSPASGFPGFALNSGYAGYPLAAGGFDGSNSGVPFSAYPYGSGWSPFTGVGSGIPGTVILSPPAHPQLGVPRPWIGISESGPDVFPRIAAAGRGSPRLVWSPSPQPNSFLVGDNVPAALSPTAPTDLPPTLPLSPEVVEFLKKLVKWLGLCENRSSSSLPPTNSRRVDGGEPSEGTLPVEPQSATIEVETASWMPRFSPIAFPMVIILFLKCQFNH